jgi:nitrogen fixation protein NifU and related proteins
MKIKPAIRSWPMARGKLWDFTNEDTPEIPFSQVTAAKSVRDRDPYLKPRTGARSSLAIFGLAAIVSGMTEDLQKRIQAALANPQNMGEMTGADSIGTVGNADCGEMLRLWVKFKEQNGKRVIDRATFQSFGCETAIAVASLATELIRGKTAEEALALKTEELAGELGPLPPMKIHCAQLVEGALRSALAPEKVEAKIEKTSAPSSGSNLLDSFSKPKEGVKLTFLD